MILLSKRSKLKLNWMVTVIVYALKILGLAPLSHHIMTLRTISGETCTVRGFRSSKIGTAYSILVLVLLQAIIGLALFLYSRSDETVTPPRQVAIIGSISLCSLATSAIIISSSFRQTEAVSVMNRLLEVDLLLSGIEKHPLSQRRMVRYFFLHSMFNVLLWLILIVWIASTGPFNWEFSFELITKVLSYLVYWFIIEYSIVLGVLANEVERVNENLLKLKESPYDSSRKWPFISDPFPLVILSPRGRLATIKSLRSIRTTLYEVSKDVAEFYSFTILVSVGSSCWLFITDILRLMYALREEITLPLTDICLHTSSIVKVAYPITLLALNVTKIGKEAELTGWIAHKLLATATGQEVKAELEQFSLHVLHERFGFTAYGLFSLDCEMLHSILQLTATYIMTCVQSI